MVYKNTHAFDQALELKPLGDGRYAGHTHPAWANMVGPFGGVTAATVINAIAHDALCVGEPLSLTVNFVAAVVDGPFELHLKVARTNRSTQHWTFEIVQVDPETQGEGSMIVITGTAMTGLRRATWSASDMPMPLVPSPADLPVAAQFSAVKWLERYDMRSVVGGIPMDWGHAAPPTANTGTNEITTAGASLSQLWVRDAALRPMDFASLTAFADIFFPRIFLRRRQWVPAGTVSMTVYFHASLAQLEAMGNGYVLAQAQGQEYRHGFFDQASQLWNEQGHMLATTHQLVYFKA